MNHPPLTIPKDVLALCRRMRERGHRIWVVGGSLRDMLRGEPHDDWDLATSARPHQVLKVFRRVIPTGIQHGTVTVLFRKQSYELTTLRGEGTYSDGRRPDQVHFVDDIEADLARRDFTVNAIAYEPFEEVLTDPFGGLSDLRAGRLRAVGDPMERFAEDGLRVLRAARFVATLEAKLDPDTEAAIGATLDTFRQVSHERVRDEWLKALAAASPSRAFEVMRRTGLWAVILGPLAAHYDQTTWTSAQRAVDTPAAPIERLTGLLHPCADDLRAVEKWLVDFRFSNLERTHVTRLLGALQLELDDVASDAALRRFASRVGREYALPCLELRARALSWSDAADERVALRGDLCARARVVLDDHVALSVRELDVNGTQLIQRAGVPRGPEIGRLLGLLLEEVLEEPARNRQDWLIERARELVKA